jgi:hypothetical protein
MALEIETDADDGDEVEDDDQEVDALQFDQGPARGE